MESGPISMLCGLALPGPAGQILAVLSALLYPAVAIVTLRAWRDRSVRDWPVLALIGLIVAIGAGAVWIRLAPSGAARMAEMLAAVLFVAGCFYLAMRRFLFLTLWPAIGATAAFGLFARGSARQLGFLMGDAGIYAPALWALLILGGLLVALRQTGGRVLMLATGLMAAAVGVRMAEGALCSFWPAGLILWDGLMASVLALLAGILLRFGPAEPADKVSA